MQNISDFKFFWEFLYRDIWSSKTKNESNVGSFGHKFKPPGVSVMLLQVLGRDTLIRMAQIVYKMRSNGVCYLISC